MMGENAEEQQHLERLRFNAKLARQKEACHIKEKELNEMGNKPGQTKLC